MRFLFASVALSLVGCSLVTSLDGLKASGVVADAGTPLDAAPDVDAAVLDSGPPVVGTLGFVAHWATNGSAISAVARPGGGWFIGGSFQNTLVSYVAFGGYQLPKAKGGSDIFLAALDQSGNPTALATFGATSNDGVDAIATDASGDIYLGGHTDGMTLGSTTLPLGAFVAKLNGKDLTKPPLWVTPFASDAAGFCPSCLKVAGTSLVALGMVGSPDYGSATLTYGSGTTLTTNGQGDLFLARLDASTGAVSSMAQAGSVANDRADGLDVDEAGDAFFAASFRGPIKAGQLFGSKVPSIVGTNAYNVVVARVASSGNVVWSKSYGDPGSSPVTAEGIALDHAGRIAVGVTLSGGVDLGLGPIAGTNGNAAVFVMNEATQTTVFQQGIGGPQADYLTDVAFDPWGHLVVAGSYGAGATIGTQALPQTAGPALFVAKFSPTYALEWAHGGVALSGDGGLATSAGVLGYHLTTASNGAIVLAGGLFGTTEFGAGPVARLSAMPYSSDALVVGYQP